MTTVVAWIIIGLMLGLLANRMMPPSRANIIYDTTLGVVGALVGGLLFQNIIITGGGTLNVWSMVAATIGAASVLATNELLVDHRASVR